MSEQADRRTRPFDSGLQPERTALAWRRTSLALVVGALVFVRLLAVQLGVVAAAAAGVGLLIAIGIFMLSHLRYRNHHRILTSADHDRVPLADGRLLALTAAITASGGLLALLGLLASFASGHST